LILFVFFQPALRIHRSLAAGARSRYGLSDDYFTTKIKYNIS
jgi:hypothetical protein